MTGTRGSQQVLKLSLVLAGLIGLAAQAAAYTSDAKIKELRSSAESYEKVGNWDKAADLYEELLRIDRKQVEVQDRYRNCLRHINQIRRHRDESYRQQVLTLKYSQALRLLEVVNNALLDASIERNRVDAAQLFRKGLEELRNALQASAFLEEHVRGQKAEDLTAFRLFLNKYDAFGPVTREQAAEMVREIAIKGLIQLKLNPTVVVMEFACGACHAIDDYTAYLTPSQIRELAAALEGQPGVGVKLALSEGKLVISEVLPDSPAAEAMLLRDDQVIAIDKKTAGMLTAEVAMGLLEGEAGSVVEMTVLNPVGLRTVMLRRRAVFTPSVHYQIKPGGIGYLQITAFQDSTLTELDAGLLALLKGNAKGLILDLRGNGGGFFEVAVETAKRFLSSGVIASTQHLNPKDNAIYRATQAAPWTLPVVVLVDADTASAAEVLAGALKENGRARLVGQTTFGKGCTQVLLRLPAKGLLNPVPEEGGPATGGLRVTVAHFFSPSGQPYSGRGVVPHVSVNRRLESMDDTDQQLQAARLELQRLVDR